MTTDIHAAMQEIREALAAGPTPGPWIAAGPSFGAPLPKYLNEVLVDRPGDDDDTKTVAQSVCGIDEAGSADIAFIAACNPEAITTILAALEARDAEIAALREDVMEMPLCATEKCTLRVGQAYRFVPVVGCASCDRLAAQERESYGDGQPKPPPIYPSTEGQRIARQIRGGKEGKGVRG